MVEEKETTLEEESVVENPVIEEKEEINYKELSIEQITKLKKRTITAVISFTVIFFSSFFDKYNAFDVAMTSIMFRLLLGVTVVFLIISWVYYFIKGEELESPIVYKEMKTHNSLLEFLVIIPVFIAVVTGLNAFMISPASIVKSSMEPNYFEDDNILVYHFFENYDRFDVIIAKVSEEEYYIKRIIGLPGETVRIHGGEIFINGVLLEDTTTLKVGAVTACDSGSAGNIDDTCVFLVPEGEYFVLGDNREGSIDSRYSGLGFIEEEDLFGKVILRIGKFK